MSDNKPGWGMFLIHPDEKNPESVLHFLSVVQEKNNNLYYNNNRYFLKFFTTKFEPNNYTRLEFFKN